MASPFPVATHIDNFMRSSSPTNALSALGIDGNGGYIVKTANYTAVAGDKIAADTTGGAFTVTLPATPADGDSVEIIPARGTFATNNLTVARNGENIDGAAANLILTLNLGAIFTFRSSYGWRASILGFDPQNIPENSTIRNVSGRTILNFSNDRLIFESDGNYMAVLYGGQREFAFGSLIMPFSDNTRDIGRNNDLRWRNIYTSGFWQTGAISTPSVPATNSVRIYSKDVSGTAEVFVMDEAGNETQISPHAAQHAPDSMVDSAWDEVGYSANYYTGVIVWTNRSRETAKLANARGYESFEEYNTRRGLTGDLALVMWDWDTVQSEHVTKSIKTHDEWLERKAKAEADKVEFTEPEPAIIVAKPVPEFLSEQINTRQQFLAERFSRKKLYPDAEMYQIHEWMHDNKLDPDAIPQIISSAFTVDVERKKALSRWSKAVRVPRDHPLVDLIGSRMTPALTPQQIDNSWEDITKL